MQHLLPRNRPVRFASLLLVLTLLASGLFFVPAALQSASSLAPVNPWGECDVVGNKLYLLDGAATPGVIGSLAFTAGSAASSDSMPAANNGAHLVYRITGVNGTYASGPTRFSLFVDAGQAVGNGIQTEIRYDFDGNGSDDRVERYNYFATNPVVDWENYLETSSGGIQTATGTYANLSNGTIQIHLWNAIGGGPSSVRTSASASDGQQSRLTLPFSGLSINGCVTSTPTITPTPSDTPTATPTSDQPPTATPTVTPTPTSTTVPTPAPVSCLGVANTAVALPGVGCYTTNLPAGEKSVTYWPAVDDNTGYSPATPKITGNYTGPLQTNDWWSSLIWDWNQGAAAAPPREPYSQIMHPHPFSMQAQADGMRMSYARELQFGTNTAGTGAVTGFANYLLPGNGAEHLKVTVAGMNAPSTQVDSYSDWAVTAHWNDGANTLTATFGEGLPYVFFEQDRRRFRDQNGGTG